VNKVSKASSTPSPVLADVSKHSIFKSSLFLTISSNPTCLSSSKSHLFPINIFSILSISTLFLILSTHLLIFKKDSLSFIAHINIIQSAF
jgi:hypothetical protein